MFLYFIYSIQFNQFYYIILIQINFKMYFFFYCHFFFPNFLICIQYHDYLYYYELIFMMRRKIFFDDLILLEACFMLFLIHLLRDPSLIYSSFLLDVYFLYFYMGCHLINFIYINILKYINRQNLLIKNIINNPDSRRFSLFNFIFIFFLF